MPNVFGPNEIVILLGAGASVEAGIPASAHMIDRVEKLLENKWSAFRDLYNYIKSAILLSRGIKGIFDTAHYNIESLVYTLDELVRGDEHALYPFIGSWTPKLLEVTKGDLSKVREFRNLIVKQLRDEWVQLRHEAQAHYFEGLHRFQKEYQYPLRIFTLNYDLCVEKVCKGARIQRGFSEHRKWEWRLFDESCATDCDIYLYKLHGSIDWTYEDSERLTYYDSITHIAPEELAIIFGVTYKLQYIDPFLFFAYEFRRWTLDASRLIVSVGYGFGDDHINGIIRQALTATPSRRLLVVSPKKFDGLTPEQTERESNEHRSWIKKRIGIKEVEQVVWRNESAKEFLSKGLCIQELVSVLPPQEEPFPEIATSPPSAASATPSRDGAGRRSRKSRSKPKMNRSAKRSATE